MLCSMFAGPCGDGSMLVGSCPRKTSIVTLSNSYNITNALANRRPTAYPCEALSNENILMNTPDWLRIRGGDLKLGSDQKTWYVIIAGKPLYDLVAGPASGKHSCDVRETNNGQPIPSKGIYASADDALRGGLDDLANYLGWKV